VYIWEICKLVEPDLVECRIEIFDKDGEVAVVIPGHPPAGERRPSSRMESDILNAMEEAAPRAKLAGDEIARLAGYDFDMPFRRALSNLRRAGLVVCHRPGFSLP
jgi:hypothetical protein